MTMDERRDKIVELVNAEGSIGFARLKQSFPDVSEMTLRTDLKALDEARRIVRVHGGAKSIRFTVRPADLLAPRMPRKAPAHHAIAPPAARSCARARAPG